MILNRDRKNFKVDFRNFERNLIFNFVDSFNKEIFSYNVESTRENKSQLIYNPPSSSTIET